MLKSVEECAAPVLATFAEWSGLRPEYGDGWTNHGYEITQHRVTPDHVIFAYGAAPDPVTGSREVLAGNVPFAVDRRTGEIVDSIPVMVEHWPEMPLPHHVLMWLEVAARDKATIRPEGALSGVNTIEAIRAFRKGWPRTLREAKATVEAMVAQGVATLGMDDLAPLLSKESARKIAARLCDDLLKAGVRVDVDGHRLSTILAFIDRPPVETPFDPDGAPAIPWGHVV